MPETAIHMIRYGSSICVDHVTEFHGIGGFQPDIDDIEAAIAYGRDD